MFSLQPPDSFLPSPSLSLSLLLEGKLYSSWPFIPKYFSVCFLRIRILFYIIKIQLTTSVHLTWLPYFYLICCLCQLSKQCLLVISPPPPPSTGSSLDSHINFVIMFLWPPLILDISAAVVYHDNSHFKIVQFPSFKNWNVLYEEFVRCCSHYLARTNSRPEHVLGELCDPLRIWGHVMLLIGDLHFSHLLRCCLIFPPYISCDPPPPPLEV